MVLRLYLLVLLGALAQRGILSRSVRLYDRFGTGGLQNNTTPKPDTDVAHIVIGGVCGSNPNSAGTGGDTYYVDPAGNLTTAGASSRNYVVFYRIEGDGNRFVCEDN